MPMNEHDTPILPIDKTLSAEHDNIILLTNTINIRFIFLSQIFIICLT